MYAIRSGRAALSQRWPSVIARLSSGAIKWLIGGPGRAATIPRLPVLSPKNSPGCLPPALHPFSTDRIEAVRSGKTIYVRFDLNDYSIPPEAVGRQLALVASDTRYSEIRLLRWSQIDLIDSTVQVGKSKTDSGTGRVIPLNARAKAVLEFWASHFPEKTPTDYAFPSERYGTAGDKFAPCTYAIDPTKPIGRWKEAWEAAKTRAKVECRFHDLRHTDCTRMLEAGAPFPLIARVWDGPQRPRSAWQNATATSDTPL